MVRGGLLIGVIALAATGCGGGGRAVQGGPVEPDCAAQLVWAGVSHQSSGELRQPLALGERLGRGRIPGCGDDPGSEVNVAAIRGVDPSVAVGVEGGEWPYAWLRPGYVPESPRHPLHGAIFGSPREPDAEAGFRCGRPWTIRARALSTPAHDLVPLTVAPEDEALRPILSRDGVRGVVTVDADTVFAGFERDGIPFVQAGDRFALTLRECLGTEDEPGLNGLRRLVVERLGPADRVDDQTPVATVEEIQIRDGRLAVGFGHRAQADQDAGPVGPSAFSVGSADALERVDERERRKVVQRSGNLAFDGDRERLPRLIELVQRAAGALDGAVEDVDSPGGDRTALHKAADDGRVGVRRPVAELVARRLRRPSALFVVRAGTPGDRNRHRDEQEQDLPHAC